MTVGPVRVTYPGESANPLCFTIKGIDVDHVMVLNGRGEALEVRSGDKLSAEFGEPIELWIYPKADP